MRKLLLASHGPLARAMRETLQLFCGEDPRVKVLCAYVDEDTMDVNELIDFWDRSRDPADQWIVITDVYGGSVNNAFMEGSVRPNLTRSAVRRRAGRPRGSPP